MSTLKCTYVHINIDVTLPVPTLYSYTSQYLPSIVMTVLILDIGSTAK